MKIILTCGHPYSGFESAYQTLLAAGLGAAQPSRREQLSCQDLHRNILQAHDLDAAGLAMNKPLSPGKVWQETAADLFMGNTQQQPWGWADARSTWLLEFWKTLDPRTCFVLTYSSPEVVVGQMLRDAAESPEAIREAINSWTAYNTEILRFYHRNQDRCLLVNATAALHEPASLIEKTVKSFGLHLNKLPQGSITRASGSPLASVLAKTLIENCSDAIALYRELESSSDLHDAEELAQEAEKLAAWQQFADLSESHNTLQQERDHQQKLHAECKDKLDQLNNSHDEQARLAQQRDVKQAQENELLLVQLHQVQEELEQQFLKHQESLSQIEQLNKSKNEQATLTKKYQAELAQENELLLLQLHQTQEEFEQQFLKHQESLGQIEQLSKSKNEQATLAKKYQAELAQAIKASNEAAKLTQERQQQANNNADLAQENELLLLQLHQVQEELEHYFLKYQEIAGQSQGEHSEQSQPVQSRFWHDHPPTAMVVDLRREVEGDNWYFPEHDGRWAGPEKTSTISVPALGSGEYNLRLDVVDAMDAEIVANMQVCVNGLPIQVNQATKRKFFSIGKAKKAYPMRLSGSFNAATIAENPIWKFEFKFSKLVSPASHGSDDERNLAIRLGALRLHAID